MWPNNWHKHPAIRKRHELTLGEKYADYIRNGMGSWPFVFSFFGFITLWIVLNSLLLNDGFDRYPFILLNLGLSMLAAVQASALLIAAKRADAIASEIAVHTEKNTDDLKDLISENTKLTEQTKKNTDVLEDIFNILKRKEG